MKLYFLILLISTMAALSSPPGERKKLAKAASGGIGLRSRSQDRFRHGSKIESL
jgi:hypothetical protein